ncbi:MAG: polyprenyl synthetase family protein, partial [Deltaproteobacteria bacterium]|nr:polyprenyl synthetase family protein [Deltaproteobacteria bacterium]
NFSSISSKNGLSEEIRRRLLDYFYSTLGEMIEGQSKDIASKNNDMTVDKILEMYEQKSGALYGFSAVAGGLVGKASDAELDFLSKYGRRMGTAYQILDDILDIEGTTEELGKPAKSDIGNKKSTYPSILGVEKSKKLAKEQIDAAYSALAEFDAKADPLREIARYIINRKS